MAIGEVVSRRYAKALFEVAKEHDIISEVEKELRMVVSSIEENAGFEKLLRHPNIDASVKINLLQQVFGGYISDTLLGTLELLIHRRRETLLPELLKSYLKISDESLGQANAVVYTPFSLTELEVSQLSEKFGRITGKKIIVQNVLQPDLIGGIQIRIGDRLIDGSLSGKLTRLKKYLNQTQAI